MSMMDTLFNFASNNSLDVIRLCVLREVSESYFSNINFKRSSLWHFSSRVEIQNILTCLVYHFYSLSHFLDSSAERESSF